MCEVPNAMNRVENYIDEPKPRQVQSAAPGYVLGDVMSLNGSRDMEATTCGIVTEYNGRLVVFYGQDGVGQNCFDEIDTVVAAGFLYEGNIKTTPELKSELGI